MLRRLAHHQPDSFAFTPANAAWAEAQISKYPAGRQASAIIPLLWRAQEQEGWLSKPAIEAVADLLGMAYIRALEVATFYFMFQLHPVGKVAHVQVCGTLSCMISGAEDLVGVCKSRIAPGAHEVSADGNFSWEEVECLGACANAPMAQIGKDYYEDLTPDILNRLLDELAAGNVPVPGPQNGRYASEPKSGLTSLKAHEAGRMPQNASVELARSVRDTVKRIDGTEVPLTAPWRGQMAPVAAAPSAPQPKPGAGAPADATGVTVQQAQAMSQGKPVTDASANAPNATVAGAAAGQGSTGSTGVTPPELTSRDVGSRPKGLDAPRAGKADDLQVIKGIGPGIEALLHRLGFFHFDQVAAWTADELAWVDANLEGFKGRATRDRWIEQAKILMAGGSVADF
jgi:NADH-quinone oxidoreductase subunit E